MSSVVSAIKNTVQLSNFDKGLAGKIFSEVKSHDSKVVMKITARRSFLFRRTNTSKLWTL